VTTAPSLHGQAKTNQITKGRRLLDGQIAHGTSRASAGHCPAHAAESLLFTHSFGLRRSTAVRSHTSKQHPTGAARALNRLDSRQPPNTATLKSESVTTEAFLSVRSRGKWGGSNEHCLLQFGHVLLFSKVGEVAALARTA
jgi:hypothetical protein